MSSEERSGGRSFNKPVEEGKEYEVDIKETSRRGDGVARVEGFVIFVPETKPGEHVKVRITQVGPRFATGEVVKQAPPAISTDRFGAAILRFFS